MVDQEEKKDRLDRSLFLFFSLSQTGQLTLDVLTFFFKSQAMTKK